MDSHVRVAVLVIICCCGLFSACSNSGDGAGAYPKAVNKADETSAIQSLRTIATAETQAKAMRNSYVDLATLVQLGFLDERFAGPNPNIRGYRFAVTATENEYSVVADPQPTATAPATGGRHFYLDSTDNVIRVNATQGATRQDPSL